MSMNEVFKAIAARSLRSQAAKEGDYQRDGLLYCGKCNTPRQAIKNFLGETVKVGIMCECEAGEYRKKREMEDKDKRYTDSMAWLKEYHIHEETCREWFDDRVSRYLSKWDDMYKKGIGLLLWGNTGNGKSKSAAYLVKELQRMKVPAIFTQFSVFGDVKQRIPNLNYADLVVFDDLGAQRDTPFMMERIFELIDRRTISRKPVVYTTNFTLEQIEHPEYLDDIRWKRIFSRVLERTVPIHFDGPDYRLLNMQKMMSKKKGTPN